MSILHNRFWVDKARFKNWMNHNGAVKTDEGIRLNKTFIDILEEKDARLLLEVNVMKGPIHGDTNDIIAAIKLDCQ